MDEYNNCRQPVNANAKQIIALKAFHTRVFSSYLPPPPLSDGADKDESAQRETEPILYSAGTQRDNEAVREDPTTQAIKGGKGALPLFEYRAKPFLLLPLMALLLLEDQDALLNTLPRAPFDPLAFAITLPITYILMPY